MTNKNEVLCESPITDSEQDIFNYRHYAEKLQQLIQANADNPEPLTIGIYGKWGEGKTSFLNLVEKQLDLWKKDKGGKGLLKYHFNPWRYSTEDEMLFDFFDGLAKQMFLEKNPNLKKIGKGIIRFSRYLKSVKLSSSIGGLVQFGPKISFEPGQFFQALGEDVKGEELTIEQLKNKVNDYLTEEDGANYKIVVFIDDIDRLDKDEIYTILKLVKLNANFKNFVYILALDDEQVAKAIGKRFGDDEVDGQAYLEKIINIPIYLPKIGRDDYYTFLSKKLMEVKNNLNLSEEKIGELDQMLNEYDYGFFKSGREVIRVVNSFFISAFAIGDEVHLRDLFWLEYLKVKAPKVYLKIKERKFRDEAELKLITQQYIFGTSDAIRYKNHKNVLGDDENYIVDLLFPKQNKTKDELESDKSYLMRSAKELRVSIPMHFEKYFSFHLIGKLSEQEKKEIIANIKQRKAKETLESLLNLKESVNKELMGHSGFLDNLINDESFDREFLYKIILNEKFLLKSSDQDEEQSVRLRIISLIGRNLDQNEFDFNLKNITNLLDIEELYQFSRSFKTDTKSIEELEKILGDKVKEEFTLGKRSFFKNIVKRYQNRAFMESWINFDEVSYNKYIKNHFLTLEDLKEFLKNFQLGVILNSSFTEQDYMKMKELVDVSLIFTELKKLNSGLVKKVAVPMKKDEFAKQDLAYKFIYWHKRDLARKN